MRIIAYIIAGICILFGILFILGAFGPTGGGFAYILIGVILVLIAFGLIFWAGRQKQAQSAQNVTYKIDLPGDVQMDTLKCKACGGTLGPQDIQMVNGAPVVTCPYCHTTYQLTEEPKW